MFVDRLLDPKQLDASNVASYEMRNITYSVDEAEPDSVVNVASQLLSECTRQLGFVVAPRLERIVLSRISLVRLSSERVLVVLVSKSGGAYRRVIAGDGEWGQRELDRTAVLLSERAAGRTLVEVRAALIAEAERLRDRAGDLLVRAIDLGRRAVAAGDHEVDLVIETRLALLDQPEFHDPQRIRDLFAALETKQRLARGARPHARLQRRLRGLRGRGGRARPARLRARGKPLRRPGCAARNARRDRPRPDGLRARHSARGLSKPGHYRETRGVSGGPRDENRKPDPDQAEGWESLSEESEGSLAVNPELEAALQEASEAIDEEGHVKGPEEPAASESFSGEEIERMAGQLVENRDKYVRLLADFDNFRRRAHKDRQDVIQYGHENLVKDLLSTVDNLDRAIEHAHQEDGGDLASLLEGVELVQREFYAVLAQHEVHAIDAEGKRIRPVAARGDGTGAGRFGASEQRDRGAAEGLSAAGSAAETRAGGGREAARADEDDKETTE